MPLTILIPLILVGLPLVIGLVYLAGGRKEREKLTGQYAETLFNLDFPGTECEQVVVDDDAQTALIARNGAVIGIVTEFGQNHITRNIDYHTFKAFKETEQGVDVWLNDFTLKHIGMAFADPDKRNDVLKLLKSSEVNRGSDNS